MPIYRTHRRTRAFRRCKIHTNYIKQQKTAEVKDGIKQKPPVSAPKTRENNTVPSSSAIPKTKEQADTDARKKYVSEKLKTKANVEKAAKQAAKQAKQAAQKAAVKITVKVDQMVVVATKAIISALAALGGWAVLLVALIIVIVVAANSVAVTNIVLIFFIVSL